MADFFKNLDKYIKDWHILTFLGLLVLGYVVYEYSGRQNLLVSNYQGITSQNVAPRVVSSPSTSANAPSTQASGAALPAGVDALQDNLNGPAQLGQVPSTISPVPTNNMGNQQMMDPSELLPSSGNQLLDGNVNPELSGMNNLLGDRSLSMLNQTLRNANYQLRSDPVIPAGPAPCFQTTITKDDTGVGLNVC